MELKGESQIQQEPCPGDFTCSKPTGIFSLLLAPGLLRKVIIEKAVNLSPKFGLFFFSLVKDGGKGN